MIVAEAEAPENAPAADQSTEQSSSSSSVAPSSRASHRRASGSTPLNTSGSVSPAKSREAAPVHSSSASAASADRSVGEVRKSGLVQSPPPGYGPSAMSDHSPRLDGARQEAAEAARRGHGDVVLVQARQELVILVQRRESPRAVDQVQRLRDAPGWRLLGGEVDSLALATRRRRLRRERVPSRRKRRFRRIASPARRRPRRSRRRASPPDSNALTRTLSRRCPSRTARRGAPWTGRAEPWRRSRSPGA